jgi:hypothetical protein
MVSYTTKLIDDAVAEARTLINDSMVPYRYTDQQVVTALNTALRDLYLFRPDAYIGNFTSGVLSNNPVPTYVAATDLGQNIAFPVDDRLFFSPITFYMAGRIELSDDEFTDNSRAAQLLSMFRNMLTGA